MFQIRTAAYDDGLQIAQVQVDSYRTAYADIFPDSYLAQFTYEEECRDWQEIIQSGANHVLLVAESDDNQVIGYALSKYGHGAFSGYDAEIAAMYVRQPYQRQGVGRALLRHSLEALQEHGCRSMMLWTLVGNPAQAWYERLGGQRIDQKRYHVDEREIMEVAYAWKEVPRVTA